MLKWLITITLFLITSQVNAATFWVRSDGGTISQCDGKTDHALAGASGTNCAVSSLYEIIRHSTDGSGGFAGTTVVSAADTIIIGDPGASPGQFQMGYNTTALWSGCSTSYPYGCYLDTIPAGSSSSSTTKVYGRGYDTGCTGTKVQLWGNERVYSVLALDSNTDMQCIEVTDHSGCIESGPSNGNDANGFPVKCERTTYPYGAWASRGIDIVSGATAVSLTNVDIHGLGHTGIFAYRVGDVTLSNVNIEANGWVGWDSDGTGDDSYTGTVSLSNVKIQFNGCGELYPRTATDRDATTDLHDCWSQTQGGYGDGIGLGDGTPGNWNITNSSVSWNTSDGIDLLHGSGNAGILKVIRSRAEGNAGQQVKGSLLNNYIESSIINGNCGFFYGKSYTSTKDTSGSSVSFDNCRANGDTITFSNAAAAQKMYINNSTIFSNGDSALISSGTGCDGSTVLQLRNNIFYLGRQWSDDTAYNGAGGNDQTGFYYASGSDGSGAGTCGSLDTDEDYNIIYNAKSTTGQCTGGGSSHSLCASDPLLTTTPSMGPTTYMSDTNNTTKYNISVSSPAIAAGLTSVTLQDTSNDYNNYNRGASWDIGALEYGSVAPGGRSSQTSGAIRLIGSLKQM